MCYPYTVWMYFGAAFKAPKLKGVAFFNIAFDAELLWFLVI